VFEVVRAAGVAYEKVSPFSFGMEHGVIVSAGSALADRLPLQSSRHSCVEVSAGTIPGHLAGLGASMALQRAPEFVQKLARLSNLPPVAPGCTQSRLVENEAEMQRANSGTPGIAVGCDSK
jgi:hypothetical protein